MAAPLTQVRVFVQTSAPTSGSDGTGAGLVRVGDLLVVTTGPALYICSATTPSSGTGTVNSAAVASSVTWTLVP